ncbi:MAG: GDP-mannose 4,6-dehydratase [Thermomicrobiales bacterium]
MMEQHHRWTGRNVLVTGATGLVGSWLIRDLLARGANVVAFVRDPDPQSEFWRSGDWNRTAIVQGQLEDFRAVERAINEHAVDTVFHLGAQPIVSVAHRSPLPTFEANIRGTYHVLEACRLHQDTLIKRVVVASSDKAYGAQATLPYTEDAPLEGRNPYEVSKSCADLLATSYHASYGAPVATARCGNIFGGGDLNWSRIVPDTIRALLHNERPVLRSDGTFIRDYLYVRDVSRAYLRLADGIDDAGAAGHAFNFSPERAVTVLELVAIIQRLMGREDLAPDIRATAQGEIHSQYLDATKAQRVLGWEPAYGLEDALAETIAWYRAYFATPRAHAPLAAAAV